MSTISHSCRLAGALLLGCAALQAAERENKISFVSLSMRNAHIIEGIGACVGSIDIKDEHGNPATLDDNIDLCVTTTLPDRIEVTQNITVSAGSSAAMITVEADENDVVEGTETAQITASSPMASATTTLVVSEIAGGG
jgi:hypothetical protein